MILRAQRGELDSMEIKQGPEDLSGKDSTWGNHWGFVWWCSLFDSEQVKLQLGLLMMMQWFTPGQVQHICPQSTPLNPWQRNIPANTVCASIDSWRADGHLEGHSCDKELPGEAQSGSRWPPPQHVHVRKHLCSACVYNSQTQTVWTVRSSCLSRLWAVDRRFPIRTPSPPSNYSVIFSIVI